MMISNHFTNKVVETCFTMNAGLITYEVQPLGEKKKKVIPHGTMSKIQAR